MPTLTERISAATTLLEQGVSSLLSAVTTAEQARDDSQEYAQGTEAGTGGSSKNWAQQTGADVTGATANSRSSKSWAQDDLTGATLGGSAKDWAQSASLPDGVNKSAKSYAGDALTSANNAAASAIQAALIAAGLNYISAVAAASLPDPATRTAGDVYLVTTAGTAWTKTWAVNDLAIRNGAGGYDQVASTLWLGINAALVSSKAPRGGIVSAGTSAVATTQDNTGLAFGTSNFTLGTWAQPVDWTPSATKVFAAKYASSLGFQARIGTDGKLTLLIGNGTTGTAYTTTNALGLADGAEAFIALSVNRAGNLGVYVNGALFENIAISAQAAQTLTNTGALIWGSDSSGGTNIWAGKIGESWIINGLLTASRIADIYRAGSIAPFCTMTANATTGQNTATIDGLSFFQWLECDQGYGPIIRDRSGNNQHALMGTSGLFHAVRRNPPGVPQRAPRTALVGDGSSGAFVRSASGQQDPTTGPLTDYVDFLVSSETTTARAVLCHTPQASGVTTRALNLTQSAFNSLTLRHRAADNANYRQCELANFATLFGGKRVVVAWNRSRLFLAVDGDLWDVTNLTTELTVGTPPAFADQIDGTYFLVGADGASVTNQPIYDARFANVAMTEAQLRAEYERGEPGPEWVGASKTASYTSNFSAGVDGWAAGGAGRTVTGNIDADADGVGLPPTNDWIRSRRDVGAGVGSISLYKSTLITGARYSVIFECFVPAGFPTTHVTLRGLSDSSFQNFSGPVALTPGAVVSANFTLTTSAANGGLLVIGPCTVNGDTQTVAEGTTMYVKNVIVTRLGWTTRLRTDSGGGYQARNDARSATNDATNFDLSTTGITWSPEAPVGARVSIVKTFAHGSISTSNGTTLFGSLPANWALVDFQANVDVAFDTGVTVSIGTSAAPTRWVNALAVDSIGLKQATSAQLYPQSTSAATSVYIKKSGTSTVGNLLICTAILERKY
jgi:hypothetical protein